MSKLTKEIKNDWALVVGINDYPRAGVDPLQGAVYDAKKFHEWVISPKGGNVPSKQAMLVPAPEKLTPRMKVRPILPTIQEFFIRMREKLDGKTGNRLYIYLSGHGISPTTQESSRHVALLMANATPPSQWDNFTGNVWAAAARDAALFKEVVLFMDCCRDSPGNASVHSFPGLGDPSPNAKDCLLVEAYATRWNSKAREIALPPDNKVQGVFTHSLLKVLWSGQMTGSKLRESVIAQLAQTLKDETKAQQAEIVGDLDKIKFNEQADPVITQVTIKGLAADAPPMVESWGEDNDNDQSMLIEPKVWKYDVPTACWRGLLPVGTYELRKPTGRGQRIHVLAGIPKEVQVTL